MKGRNGALVSIDTINFQIKAKSVFLLLSSGEDSTKVH